MENELLSIPRIYHQNEFSLFLQAIEEVLSNQEKKIDDITALVDVDSCPDFSLPYLAGLTKCPLWGQSPLLWRKQIKNWPHVCRMKGTKKAIHYFFDSIGITSENIESYWRDANGLYTIKKPEGEPYLDTNAGMWYNSKTHYFGVILSADEENILNLTDANLCDVSRNILQWIGLVKPFHSELIRIAWAVNNVFPYKIEHDIDVIQKVESHHCVWNIGSVRTTRWDGKFDLNSTIRLNGIYPDELYREKQLHQIEIKQEVNSKQITGYHFTNLWDGSFCLDASHQLNGMVESKKMMNHCCTVAKINNNVEKEVEKV